MSDVWTSAARQVAKCQEQVTAERDFAVTFSALCSTAVSAPVRLRGKEGRSLAEQMCVRFLKGMVRSSIHVLIRCLKFTQRLRYPQGSASWLVL